QHLERSGGDGPGGGRAEAGAVPPRPIAGRPWARRAGQAGAQAMAGHHRRARGTDAPSPPARTAELAPELHVAVGRRLLLPGAKAGGAELDRLGQRQCGPPSTLTARRIARRSPAYGTRRIASSTVTHSAASCSAPVRTGTSPGHSAANASS